MTIFLDDNLNRTSPAYLVGSSASPTGGVWSTVANANGTADPVMPGGYATLGAGIAYFYKNSAPPASADYTETGVFTATSDDWQFALLSRIQPDGSYYQFFLSSGGARIDRKTSSDGTVGTQIGANSTNISIAASNRTAHTLTFTVNGTSLSATVDGVAVQFGSGITTLTNSNIAAAGVVGFGGRGASVDSIAGDTLGGGGDTTPPTITGPGGATGSTSAVSIAENTAAVHTFTASESVTWSLNGGADAARFTINSSTGALAFSSAPDFEAPNDSDTNNTYVVVVRATDTATPTPNTTDQTVTVTVTNVADTAGSYVIPDFKNASGTPQVGLTVNWLTFTRVSDGVQVLIRTAQVTNGAGALAGSHASLVPGTAYIATGWDTAGTVSFRQFVTAT